MDFEVIEDAVLLVLMFLVFGVPALAIAARLAIRPMVEAILRLREASAAGRISEQRFAQLEAEVTTLRETVESLTEGAAFDRQLQASEHSGADLLGPGSQDRPL